MSIESKAAVPLQEVPLSELERIATVFGYSFAAPPRHLAGGYASCNFAVSLVPLDGSSATPTQAVLKFSNTCIDLADIEHQLRVLSHLQSSSYKTNYLLPRRDAAADAPLAARYLATADGGGPPLAMLVSFVVGTPGDKLLAASPSTEATMLASLGGALASLHGIEWPEPPLRHVSCGYPVCNTGELLDPSAAGVSASLDQLPDHPFVAFLRAPRNSAQFSVRTLRSDAAHPPAQARASPASASSSAAPGCPPASFTATASSTTSSAPTTARSPRSSTGRTRASRRTCWTSPSPSRPPRSPRRTSCCPRAAPRSSAGTRRAAR